MNSFDLYGYGIKITINTENKIQVMDKQKKLDTVYINIAKEISKLSHCERSKVGAIIVKDDNVVSFGYNGTPTGVDNCCERGGVTVLEVIHAEMNAILKAAKVGYSVNGATLYITLSPCIECSKLILQSGIKKVVYLEEYRKTDGLQFLKQFIEIQQHEF
jgi:dCMP deaminase